MIDNPFVTNGYAGPEYFCDRVEETALLTNLLTNGNNIALMSPRRVGKTDLMKHCFQQENVNGNYYCFLIDIYATNSFRDFVNVFGKSILEALKPKGRKVWETFLNVLLSVRSEITFDINGNPVWGLGVGSMTPPQTMLDEIFAYLRTADRHCLVAIDEFQQILYYNDNQNVEAALRTQIQQCLNANFIFAGSQRHLMSEMFLSPARPFYQFGDLMWLQKIPTSDWTGYVTSHFEREGRYISEQMVAKICETVDHYPSYVQHLASIILNRTPQGGTATEEVLPAAIKELISTNEALYMQQIEPLSGYQMNLLRAIVSGIHSGHNEKKVRSRFDLGSPSNMVRLRDALIERDLVYSEMRQLYITDPVFALWFRQRFL